MVDSQELLSTPAAAPKVEVPAPPRPQAVVTRTTSASKVVLLENDEFRDLETQEIKAQDIGDGAVLYSFNGASSPSRVASNRPVFLVLAENESANGANVDVARVQVGKGIRELAFAKNRSASSIPIVVTQVSATVQRLTVKDPLPPGDYVVLLENSNRGFLFQVR